MPDPETGYVSVALTRAARTALQTATITASARAGRRLSQSDTLIQLIEHFNTTSQERAGISDVRFGIKLISDNGHHVHSRLYAATGDQHLGDVGQLAMTAPEHARFCELLAPALTDGPDPAPDTNPVMGICGEGGRCRSCMALDPDGTGCGSTYPRPTED